MRRIISLYYPMVGTARHVYMSLVFTTTLRSMQEMPNSCIDTLKQKEERVSWLAASSLILESVNEMRSCPASDLHVALDLLPRLCPERANLTPFLSFAQSD